MTLEEFIADICIKTLNEEKVKLIKSENKEIIKESVKNHFITESMVKDALAKNTLDSICSNSRFTPLAKDLYNELIKNKKRDII